MNRRILSIVLACAMSLSLLTACGSGDKSTGSSSSTPSVQEPSFGKDLTAFYNEIMAAAEEGPFMMDLAADAEMLEVMYPGLGEVETKQLVVASPNMSAVAVEFAFAEVANAADVETVKAIFQARIDAQVAGGAWYAETIKGWQNHSEIVVIDNYVCLFVCSEKDGMIEAFRNGTAVPTWAKAQVPAEGEDNIDSGIMDMPVEDGPAAYDPETDVPAAEPSVEPEVPAVGPADTATSIDLNEFYYTTYDVLFPLDADGNPTGPFTDNIAASMPDALDAYYPGLTSIKLNQCLDFIPMMTGVPFEVVLIEVADTADVDAVKQILQNRIDTEKTNQLAYPAITENWVRNSRIAVNGNYIMMAVCETCDDFVNAFNALF